MKANKPNMIMHVLSSLDGYIARHDNSVSWLESPGDVYEACVSEDSAEIEEMVNAGGLSVAVCRQ